MSARSSLLGAALLACVASAQAPGIQQTQGRQEMMSLSGKTIRWKFVDGPTAGITFEHTLNPDGSIVWRALDGAYKGSSRREEHYGAVRVNDQTWAVSYRAESGHTLTVVLNLSNHQAIGFASNEKTWEQLGGTFEVLD